MGKNNSKLGGGGGGQNELGVIGPYSSKVVAQSEKQRVSVNDFELLKVVGKGSFGKVMQVRKKDSGKIYAMKVLRKDAVFARKQVEHTRTERRILEMIDHPYIVSLRFAFQTADKLYMVLDFFNGGELFYHLKQAVRFSEDRARLYGAEIALAIACLHEKDIIYRDLKPENILLDEDGHIKLTDFGLSKEGINLPNGAKTFCGTPEYLAPETLKGLGHGKPVDWWSLGTLLYEMLTGLPPFYNQNLNIMYERILKAELRFPPYLSDSAKSILSGLLTRDVMRRLGTNGFEEIKNHPFFAPINWDALLRREVEAPFKPRVGGKQDASNFDPEFTKQMPKDTPVQSHLSESKQEVFTDFSYTGPNALQR
eukprot:GILK01002132.1.p1 GENE.GILK01002132.1~~GILK01002132.1.p1  ORF type:complete len:390 (-),score=57.20 GILK01002132.1:348-1448(-)